MLAICLYKPLTNTAKLADAGIQAGGGRKSRKMIGRASFAHGLRMAAKLTQHVIKAIENFQQINLTRLWGITNGRMDPSVRIDLSCRIYRQKSLWPGRYSYSKN
jgi:hypothetical protein